MLSSTLSKQLNGEEVNFFFPLAKIDTNTCGDCDLGKRVISVNKFPYEDEIIDRSRALLAQVALGSTVEVDGIEEPSMNLMLASKRARYDPEAREMVKVNAKTDYLERAYKSGHITKVYLYAEDGILSQYGQSMISVNANSLRCLTNKTLRNRARIETHNAMRQQKYFEAGLLSDYMMATFSLVPTSIAINDAKKLGFFTENMSLAVQAVGNADSSGVELESAFVAGADVPDDRFDIDVVKELYRALGVDVDGYGIEQILATPLLIHNSIMKNGVVDIVALYDEIASRLTGDKRFYGRKNQVNSDYAVHKAECARREVIADEVAERTATRLVAESSTFMNPTDTTRRLHELNDAELKKLIVHDKSIDANVLGVATVRAVEQARIFYANNDHVNLQMSMEVIRSRGVSSSCPTGFEPSDSSIVGTGVLNSATEGDNKEVSGKKEVTCPFCKEKTIGDPCADCTTCTKCSASTKYSREENVRRAAQYKKIKALKATPDNAIDRIFKGIVNAHKDKS